MKSWRSPIGPLKCFSRILFFWSISIVLFYYYYFVYYLQMKQSSVVAREASNHFQDLGSNPRSPTFFDIFLLQVIMYISKYAAYHTPSSIQWPDGQRPNLVAKIWRSTMVQVSACTPNPKSQTRPACFGPSDCYSCPYFRPKPLSLSILFILFILIVLLFLFKF